MFVKHNQLGFKRHLCCNRKWFEFHKSIIAAVCETNLIRVQEAIVSQSKSRFSIIWVSQINYTWGLWSNLLLLNYFLLCQCDRDQYVINQTVIWDSTSFQFDKLAVFCDGAVCSNLLYLLGSMLCRCDRPHCVTIQVTLVPRRVQMMKGRTKQCQCNTLIQN